MKRCLNPNCQAGFLYGDDKTTCPFCHTRLVDSAAGANLQTPAIIPPDRVAIREERHAAALQPPPFVLRQHGTVECHGRVTEIDHHELFNSRKYKLANSLLRGEPYQFAHQTIEYTIRVESLADDFPNEVTDFCLYGSYLGRLQPGDEVIVRAKNLNNRRVVKSIYNATTQSVIKPGLQIPAVAIQVMLAALVLTLVSLMCSVVWLFKSGVVAMWITALLVAVMPIVIILIGFWIMIRSVFPPRRRR